MARLQILEYPDPRLRTKAKPVEVFDAALAQKVEDMFETMYAAPGVGLAATQVDFHKRLIVMDVSEGKNEPAGVLQSRNPVARKAWASPKKAACPCPASSTR